MDYWALALGVLISLIAYLASRSYDDIKDDLKELKKSQYVTNERLVRVEAKEEANNAQLTALSENTKIVYRSVDNVGKSLLELKQETMLVLNETKYDMNKTKENFGKVLLILKGQVQKTKPAQDE
jgi:uncharacterized protein (DUF3084 family)